MHGSLWYLRVENYRPNGVFHGIEAQMCYDRYFWIAQFYAHLRIAVLIVPAKIDPNIPTLLKKDGKLENWNELSDLYNVELQWRFQYLSREINTEIICRLSTVGVNESSLLRRNLQRPYF